MTKGGVYTSGGPVGGVGSTWDVNCVERGVRIDDANKRVDLLENFVDGAVATSTILPTLNHSLVVSMDGEIPVWPESYRWCTKHLKPTASAHPISHCPCKVCHPGISLQALHLPETTMVIPKPELASENMPMSSS